MSGGRYDYRSLAVGTLAAEIATDADVELDEAVREAMEHCASQLALLGELARCIEWYRSGDYGPEPVLRAFEKVRQS